MLLRAPVTTSQPVIKISDLVKILEFAKCESHYVTVLTNQITYTEFSKIHGIEFDKISAFSKYFSQQLDLLAKDFSEKAGNANSLLGIYSDCKLLRQQFKNIHHTFIVSIDKLSSTRINTNNRLMQNAIDASADCVGYSSEDNLFDQTDYIKRIMLPLAGKELLDSDLVNYAAALDDMRDCIAEKLTTLLSDFSIVKTVCIDILKKINPSSITNGMTTPLKHDAILVLKLIKDNLGFFCAPFLNFDQFQAWAKRNENLVTPFSGALQSCFMHDKLGQEGKRVPNGQLQVFKHALVGASASDKNCLMANDERPLQFFLQHHDNQNFIRFLLLFNNDDAIFQQWKDDNQPATTLKVLLRGHVKSVASFCHDFNVKFSSTFPMKIDDYTLLLDRMDRSECYEKGFRETADVVILIDNEAQITGLSPNCMKFIYNLNETTPLNCLKQIVAEHKSIENEIKLAKEKSILFLSICNEKKSNPSCLPFELKSFITCTFFFKAYADARNRRQNIVSISPDKDTSLTF